MSIIPINSGFDMIMVNKYGKIDIDRQNVISFPSGLAGISGKNMQFVIADMDNAMNDDMDERFKILQSIDDSALSIIIMEADENLIDKKDIEMLANSLSIAVDDMQIFVITSITDDGIIANVKSPIIIDMEEKTAMQYIFTATKYKDHVDITNLL